MNTKSRRIITSGTLSILMLLPSLASGLAANAAARSAGGFHGAATSPAVRGGGAAPAPAFHGGGAAATAPAFHAGAAPAVPAFRGGHAFAVPAARVSAPSALPSGNSAFRAAAGSPSSAGLWQTMPNTARTAVRFGNYGGGFGGHAARAETGLNTLGAPRQNSFTGSFGIGGSNVARQLVHNRPALSSRPAQQQNLQPSGLASVAGPRHSRPQAITQETLHSQGNRIRNSFAQNNPGPLTTYGGNAGLGSYGYGPQPWGGYGYRHHEWWNYPGAWYPAAWSPAIAWTCTSAAVLDSLLGLTVATALANTVHSGEEVIIDGRPYCTAEQYYDQALALAMSSPVSLSMITADEQWQPLGVFGLAEPGQAQPTMIVQLAIDQYGVIRGNYVNEITGETELVSGVMDRATQRLTLVIGANSTTVFDTTLYALMQPESSIFVHYGPLNTQQLVAARLSPPANL